MKEYLQKLPKTSISRWLSAILVYCLGKGYIWPDEASLISALLLALGVSVNLVTKK